MSAFVDGRTVEPDTVFTTDVCVIGAGAAGITIARELAASRHDVVLVESGGLETEAEPQNLAAGEIVGQPYPALISTRLRAFGGTTGHWAGWCTPLTAIDFARRSWVPASGWPIDLDDLTPYYERAQRTNQLGRLDYDVSKWATDDRPDLGFGGDVDSAIFQFSRPTRYGSLYRSEMESARTLRVLLHSNLLRLHGGASGGHVGAATFRTLTGTSFRIIAQRYVLACGGIENARILLLTHDDAPAGFGMSPDLVGRYFQEHPHVVTGTCVFADRNQSVDLYARREHRRTVTGPPIVARLTNRVYRDLPFLPWPPRTRATLRVTPEAQHRDGLLQAVGILSPRGRVHESAADVQRSISLSAAPAADPTTVYQLRLMLEQAPNVDSRVMLGDARDALGLRVARLDWRLSDLDTHTLARTMDLFARAFGRTNVGRLRIDDWVLDDPTSWLGLTGGNHHMGTTRMSDDANSGVVDRNARVHGVANLYVAGSSVFPTSGYANPTLTLTALAHRLADHLKT